MNLNIRLSLYIILSGVRNSRNNRVIYKAALQCVTSDWSPTSLRLKAIYCYVRWLHRILSDYSDAVRLPLLAHTVNTLGKNPPINRVLAKLYHFTKSIEVKLPSPILLDTHYHITDKEEDDTNLLFLLVRHVGDSRPIGSKTKPKKIIVNNTYDDRNLSSFQYLNNFGIQASTVFNRLAEEQLIDKSSKVRQFVDNKFYDMLVNKSNIDSRQSKIQINYKLTDNDKLKLMEAYPEYHIMWSETPINHTHALLASMRSLELNTLLSMCYYQFTKKPHGAYDTYIADIGGNMLTHFNSGRTNIHVCSPILDPRDDSRMADQLTNMSIRTNLRVSQVKYLRIMRNKSTRHQVICKRKGQDCNITAPFCIFFHSTYDMTLTDVVDTMSRKNALYGVAAFIFIPDIMLYEKGEITSTGVRWDIRFVDGDKYIYFSVKNDPSWGYRHRYSDYLSIVNCNWAVSTDGDIFYIEFLTNRLGVQYVKIMRSLTNVTPKGLLFRHLPTLLNNDMLIVTFYSWDHAAYGTPWDSMKKHKIVVSHDLYDSISSFALRTSEGKFTVQDVYNVAVSYRNRVIESGIAIRRRDTDKIDANELYMLANAIYVQAYRHKYDVSKASKEIIQEINSIRNFQSSGLLQKLSTFIALKLTRLLSRFSKSMVDFVFFWLSFPELFPVSIDKVTERVEVCDYVGTSMGRRDYLRRLDCLTSPNDLILDDDITDKCTVFRFS